MSRGSSRYWSALGALSSLPIVVAGCGSEQAQATEKPCPIANVAPNKAAYRDGDYTATGSHPSPTGVQPIDVAVTLKGGNVDKVAVTAKANHPESRFYQNLFADFVGEKVTGCPIESAAVDEVSGSSLTPRAFDAALGDIRKQSKES